ncbi:MAG: (2Fe-2S)-binding protein, partial [Nocardioidaceae bacterium]
GVGATSSTNGGGVGATSSTNGGGVGATSSTNGGGVGATSSTNGGGSTEQSAPVRLKAAGVDLVTMGRRGTDSLDGDRVLTLHDPGGPRHVELVVAGDRLAGATCVGAPELGTALALAYDRGTALPADPMSLLLPDRAEADGSPALMPAATPVCPCNGVAKRDVVAAWEAGARSVPEVATATRATTGCGGCRQLVCGLVDWLRASDPDTSQSADVDGEQTVPGPQRATSPSEISAS